MNGKCAYRTGKCGSMSVRRVRIRAAWAFSLVEFVGVLAIISILAAALVPVMIRRIDRAAWVAESSNLNSISAAVTQHVVRSNNIPDAVSWVAAVQAELGLAPTSISTNQRGWNRVYLIDPTMWATLPYNQTPAGAVSAPTNARIMVISSLFQALPVVSGVTNLLVFNDLWNTPPGARPTYRIWANWRGSGDDLLVSRINLQPLFHRVILVNGFGGQGYYSIGTNGPALVPSGASGTNAYYLDGTLLGLYDTNLVLQAREVVRTDMSRVFESGIWRDQINLGITNTSLTASGLGSLAAAFFTNAAPAGAPWGESSQAILGLMTSYMDGYISWSAQSPCFSYSGQGSSWNNGNFAPYNEMNAASTSLGKGFVQWP